MRTVLTFLLLAAHGCNEPQPTQKPAEAATQPQAPPSKPKPKEKDRPKAIEPQDPKTQEPVPKVGEAEAKKPLTLPDALAGVKERGEALAKEFDGELPATKKLLTEQELETLNDVLARRGERFTGAELAFMQKPRLVKWYQARAIKWALDDPTFGELVKTIWNRSPKARNVNAVAAMAIKWGGMDRVRKDDFLDVIARVEGRKGFLPEERDRVLEFAGEDYLANRP